MIFKVLPNGQNPPKGSKSIGFLLTDNWDDWFKYSTLYYFIYFDKAGEKHDIGGVKIGQFNMKEGQRRPDLPESFEKLDDAFFSLGQDESYYESLNDMPPEVRDQILSALRDVVVDKNLFENALHENVTGVSLLREVTKSTVLGQFNRIARGGARLSRYDFSYTAPKKLRTDPEPITIDFNVEPDSEPPTNIHVLIGRNGVGKTYLLNHMTLALVQENETSQNVGEFTYDKRRLRHGLFSNIVSITFSAFDPFEPLPESQNKSEGVRYSYVGLKRKRKSKKEKTLAPKTPRALSLEFGKSAKLCSRGAKAVRWKKALETLEADPIFKTANVAGLTSVDDEDFAAEASLIFGKLSSGHKIVLLTVTRLVETVEERTLVILDEPEAHLHPPLLSAFIRSLSDLLINRNGVGIIATHSPVVLQEVPKSCVWKIRRSGKKMAVDRPDIETFGENVGILTREIFGLEVTHSGFHNLIREYIVKCDDFEDLIYHFSGELGSEAKAIARVILANRNEEKHD